MDSHRIAVITDSTCDLPANLVQELGIHVVPLYLLFGEDQLRDGVDVDADGFYHRLQSDPAHPSTSQPTPADFVRAIEATGAEEVVCVLLSAALSGTIASANAAKQALSMPVHVVDSMSVSVGLGFQVLAAARARNAGGSAEEIIAAAEAVKRTLQVVFTVDTLEYLHRGGRIGAATKLLGTALQLKPVMMIPVEIGRIEPLERVRSRKRSLARLVDYAIEHVDTSRPVHVGVMHAVSLADAQHILDEAAARANAVETLITDVTPVVGAHGGPGVLGIAIYND